MGISVIRQSAIGCTRRNFTAPRTLALALNLAAFALVVPVFGAEAESKTEVTVGEEITIFDGKSLEGWRVIENFDFQDHGEISVQDGVIRIAKGKPQSGISWKGEFPRSNYRLTFEGQRVEGNDFFCGLTFPVKDEYCTLILGGWGGQVVGLSNIDGFSAIENNTTQAFEFKQGQWYRIELTVTDDRIVAKIDDEQIINQKTEGHEFSIWWEQEPVRPLGIVTYATTGAIKHLKLVRVTATKP
jgi:hypothetical protein